MSRQLFLVFTSPTDGNEQEFGRWYDEQHIPDVLKVPGVAAAQRFKVQPEEGSEEAPPRYLAIYELDTDDIQQTLATMSARFGTDEMPNSPALDSSSVKMLIVDAIGPKVNA